MRDKTKKQLDWFLATQQEFVDRYGAATLKIECKGSKVVMVLAVQFLTRAVELEGDGKKIVCRLYEIEGDERRYIGTRPFDPEESPAKAVSAKAGT